MLGASGYDEDVAARQLDGVLAAVLTQGDVELAGKHEEELVRELLDLHATEGYLLRDAAAELGASVSSLIRDFRGRFDMSPHAYLVGRRVEHARRLLLSGVAPAEAAVLSGFHDQAHLTRHFRRHVATTPARYARSGARSAG